MQRLEDAQFDGLNPDDYPVDPLIDGRDGTDPNDPVEAASEELYYPAFFVAYAADIKIGRIAPQKVNPNLFRNRNTIDVLHLLTDLKKQRDPRKFLSAFEPHNEHCQMLKRMMLAYAGMTEQGGWPVIEQGPVVKPGMTDPRVPKIRSLLSLIGAVNGKSRIHPRMTNNWPSPFRDSSNATAWKPRACSASRPSSPLIFLLASVRSRSCSIWNAVVGCRLAWVTTIS